MKMPDPVDRLTIRDLIDLGTKALAGNPDARSISQRLVAHIIGSSASGLLTIHDRDCTSRQVRAVESALARCNSGESVHRVIGQRAFYNLEAELLISPATLEPRPDTETLVDVTLGEVKLLSGRYKLRFADLGTGTGAIGLALLNALATAEAVMTDLSNEALATARANAERIGVSDRAEFLEGSWSEPLSGQFEFIVSNPPYIATEVLSGLSRTVTAFDPHMALDGGADGLDAYRAMLETLPIYLKPDGFLALEIGYDQREEIIALADATGWTVSKIVRDLEERDRVAVLRPA